MTPEEQKALDRSLLREWTVKASAVNCCKFCGAVADDATAAQLIRYVQGRGVTRAAAALIDRIVSGAYVPPGLDCTLHGVPQPHHLMLKIDPLDHPSGLARYEFLVEYDRMDPTVGIYFGCKCVTAPGADHRAMIDLYMREWGEIRDHLCTVLNNSFPDKEFRHRFRVTNNGENSTFWPSWVGLYDDEDMDFALTALRIFRKTYSQYFDGTLKPCRKLPPISYRPVRMSFTESAYTDLTAAIGKAIGHGHGVAATEIFNRFILNASAAGIFTPDPSYDYAWRYTGAPAMGLSGNNIEFSALMHNLPREIGARLGAEVPAEVKTPWSQIFKVFLDSQGVAYKDGTRTQWQTAKTDTLAAVSRLIALIDG